MIVLEILKQFRQKLKNVIFEKGYAKTILRN